MEPYDPTLPLVTPEEPAMDPDTPSTDTLDVLKALQVYQTFRGEEPRDDDTLLWCLSRDLWESLPPWATRDPSPEQQQAVCRADARLRPHSQVTSACDYSSAARQLKQVVDALLTRRWRQAQAGAQQVLSGDDYGTL